MEAFVYIWKNLKNGCQYIGYHKGSESDGYICSSSSSRFWDDFSDDSTVWEREIVFRGTSQECLKFEQDLLRHIDIRDNLYYNNSRGAEIIFTEEVIKKMSDSHKNRWKKLTPEDRLNFGKKISTSKLGTVKTEEEKKRISEALKGKTFYDRFGEEGASEIIKKIASKNTGSKRSIETKKRMSESRSGEKNPMFGRKQSDLHIEKQRERFLNNNPGKNPSEETRKKISDSKRGKPNGCKGKKYKTSICPHCGKEGGPIMKRWHFDNCKKNNDGKK